MDNNQPQTEPAVAALDEIRRWRHQHSHADAPVFAELDAILDRAAVGRIERRLDLPAATSLPEAVNAHHEVMRLRRRILADAARAWDLVEARAMRQIARFMPSPNVTMTENTADATALQDGLKRATGGPEVSARTHTPDRVHLNDKGRKVTTIRVKRACNGCGQLLGDVDNRDVDEHGTLADVRGECPNCRPLVEQEGTN